MSGPRIAVVALDHLVLTVADIERTIRFYTRVLGMEARTFDGGRVARHPIAGVGRKGRRPGAKGEDLPPFRRREVEQGAGRQRGQGKHGGARQRRQQPRREPQHA